MNGIVNARAERSRGLHTTPNLNSLYRLQAHHSPCKLAVEAIVPVGVRAKAGGNAVRNHFKDTVHGVVGARCGFHFVFHAGFGGGVDARQDHFLFAGERGNLFPRRIAFEVHAAHANYVACNLDAELADHELGESSGGYAGRGLTRRSAFQHVARIGEVVFKRAGKVCVTGPGRSHRAMLRGIAGFYRQFLLPVFPIAIDELDGDGRANGPSVAHTGEHMRLIGFDLHAAAAAVALLPAPQLAVHKFKIDRDAGGKPRNQSNQSLAVGFPCGGEADHIDFIVNASGALHR